MKNFELIIYSGIAGLDAESGNVDVEVRFPTGERYAANFFTLKNIAKLVERYKTTGENNGGKYFRGNNMIILEQLTKIAITETIEHLIAAGELTYAFEKLESDD